jgi:N5-(cytidine 5'-diphosphoramidyl)-L-glutamine hydrolase
VTKIRIGISTRVTETRGYSEKRDSIAQDWIKYMIDQYPEYQWIIIPNLGMRTENYIEQWKLNAFILTGGDSIGIYPERDQSESQILKYSIKNNIPVIGICRGMQLMHHYRKGKLKEGDLNFRQIHRAKNHQIVLTGKKAITNSYHDLFIDENTLSKEFNVFARCADDDSIEGIISNSLLGMMWHPERDKEYSNWNTKLIKNFIESNVK